MARTAYRPPKDPRGGHIRIYWDTFDSPAWGSVSDSARLAYLSLMRQKSSTNNGDLSLPITVARRYGIKSPTTLARALRELCAVGLIAVTREGGSTKGGQRLPTLYRFTDLEVYAVPSKFIEASNPTNDWRAITTIEHAQQKLAAAEQAAVLAEDARKTKRLLQQMTETTPANGAVSAKTTPANGVWTSGPLQKVERAPKVEKAAKPTLARVSAK